MRHYVIDVHTLIHTCPADPQVHVVETWRHLVAVIPTGPCIEPQRVQSGRTVTYVDCGRVLRPARRCESCSVIIDVRNAFTTNLGHEGACPTRPASDGVLAKPCPDCGLPVSAVFEDTGRHLFCDLDGATKW